MIAANREDHAKLVPTESHDQNLLDGSTNHSLPTCGHCEVHNTKLMAHESSDVNMSRHPSNERCETTSLSPLGSLADADCLSDQSLSISTLPYCDYEGYKNYICAVKGKKNFKKRVGAKQAKKLELDSGTEHELSQVDATSYRALAARANYLSADRVDIAFSS